MEILRKAPIIWRQASLGYISIGDRDRRSMWGWDIKLQTLHLVGGPIPTRNRIDQFQPEIELVNLYEINIYIMYYGQ